MLRMLTVVVAFCFAMSVSESAYAEDEASPNASQMIQQIVSRIEQDDKADCKNEEALACLKISEATCLAAKFDILNTCTKPMLQKLRSLTADNASETEMELAKCAYGVAVDNHSIDPDKYLSCVGNDAYENSDAIMQLLRNR